ncbi:MAG TPA: NAD(P)H-quinone oxidoreductase subunit 4 [Nostocaceae cyanobacterium]|nr:NAD(P)H-quinone oxidoreductase subunit 4 [Nostocaceae cyanobacterium]
MKFFTSVKNLFLYSLALLITISSLWLTPASSFAAPLDLGAGQYIAFDTTAQTQAIDDSIAIYRSLKGKVSKGETLTTDEIKVILNEINAKINPLVQAKKDLLADDPNAQTQSVDDSIAFYRSLKGKVSKNEPLTIDEIKVVLKGINDEINALVVEKKNLSISY